MASAPASNAATAERSVVLKNRLGLHMRAAKALMDAVAPFQVEVTVRHGERSANARSILSLVTLEATAGTRIALTATGPDAERALEAVARLVDERFGEDE